MLTMLTNTPILDWFLSILYDPQFSSLAVFVMTSAPSSNMSGMRLANLEHARRHGDHLW